VGGSVDGLEAIQAFLEALPGEPDLAFVVVVSGMLDDEQVQEICAAATLPVRLVDAPVDLEENTVYVAPPGRVPLVDGHTLISASVRSGARSSPVDRVFRSLARADVESAGVLLSGDGPDGALGLRILSESGGIVGVEDPAAAQRTGMPRTAIETARVDFVRSVPALAQRMASLGATDGGRLEVSPDALSDKEQTTLRAILERVRAETGQDFRGYKRSTVLRRIRRRLQVHRVGSLSAYLEVLRAQPDEVDALRAELLIRGTRFFRDPDAFRALADTALPDVLSPSAPAAPVRVWVPGCATGEEAYSLAMLLTERAAAVELDPERITIFATDVSEAALDTARRGRYPEAAAVDVPKAYRERYFGRDGDDLVVNERIRRRVLFARHDVVGDPPFIDLALVSCRNLLIDLRRSLQKKILARFHFGLREGGYLFLGGAETADLAAADYREVVPAHRVYQRCPTPSTVPVRAPEAAPGEADRSGTDPSATPPHAGPTRRLRRGPAGGSRTAIRIASEELRSMNEEYRLIGKKAGAATRDLEALNQRLDAKVEALQTPAEDLQNLLRATGVGALFLDRDLCLERHTEPAGAFVDLPPAESECPVEALSHRLEYDDLRADAATALETLTPVTREVPTDTEEWVLVRHHPYRTVEDRVAGVVVTLLDVTERKAAEADRARASDALEARDEQVDTLAKALTAAEQRERDRLSHLLHDDLQQLVYAARMKIDTLKNQATLDGRLERLAERAIALLDDSVEVTRTLSSELSPPIGNESVRDLAEWLVIRMQESHGLAVSVESRGDLMVTDRPTRLLLYRGMRELLFNVVKHAGVDEATLRLEGDEERLRVVVGDAGAGFDPGAELDPEGGTGLGNVFDRIEMIGGSVMVDAAPGEGTRISVTLPRTGAQDGQSESGA
jgi:chemotaxis methyl-accepting protein methylase/signal transduction histidine kinase